MGVITYGVPAEYVLSMKQRFGIDCFVETGTSEGGTAAWAARHFKQVITVELSEARYHRASVRLAGHANVRQLLGSSPLILAELARSLPPAIFWLDAHWGQGERIGRELQCPLLDEIAALAPCWEQAFVLVDDACLFLSPPPAGYDQAQWPSLRQVVNALSAGQERFVACFEDVFVSLPHQARGITLDYIRAGGDRNQRVLGQAANPACTTASQEAGRDMRQLGGSAARPAVPKRKRGAPSRQASPRQALETLSAILRLDSDEKRTKDLRAAMMEGRLAWAATAALAGFHLLLPALWPALVGKKLVQPIPAALRQFMAERCRASADDEQNVFLLVEGSFNANAARNQAIKAQLVEIIRALNAAGVLPGLIKGARLLLAGDWHYVAGRTLRDIDLLLAPADWAAGTAALQAIGYRPAQGDFAHPQQGAALVGPGGPAEIDLHAAPLSLHEPLALPAYLTVEGFWQRAKTIAEDGLTYRLLPAAESLVQGIIHTEIADLNYAAGDWALRYLHESAVLSQDPACDWSVLAALAGTPLARPVEAHLLAARELFGARLPEGFADSPAARRQVRRCRRNISHPRTLRRVSMLAHKFRQAMSEWYLRRKGYYPEASSGRWMLWRARLMALRDLLRSYGPRLAHMLIDGADDPLPPPRV